MFTNIFYPPELPITLYKDTIIKAIEENQIIIITGDTGSGKTTQIPKMCLDAGQGGKKLIGCTQPRRIAAMSIAERVGVELKNDAAVGFKIRFQNRLTPNTVIKFMTDGILLAETSHDSLLKQYDTIIIDEAHERSLNIDFLLGILKTKLPKRPDLKVIISSATIDAKKFSDHFSNAPVINIPGRAYPITTYYRPLEDNKTNENISYVDHAVNECIALYNNTLKGDILIFMPSERDIRDCIGELNKRKIESSQILPLFGRLQANDQRKIFHETYLRKIIVATNIAETSLTVPGIRYVIDTGLARISKYNVRAKTTSLQISRISQASCNQRAGRCGRTGPGICIRLYSEEDYLSRHEYTLPEIQRSNLSEVILQMTNLKLGNPRKFPYIDPPTLRAINEGYRTLLELGAIDETNKLTSIGKIMAQMPLDPCISKIVIEGSSRGALKEIKIIASALAIMDPRIRPAQLENKADTAHLIFKDKHSDFITYLNIWQQCLEMIGPNRSASKLRKFCEKHYLSWQRMREWFDIHDQISRLIQNNKQFTENEIPGSVTAIHQALTCGFLRNICQKKEKNLYIMSGGREVMIFPGSVLFNKGGQWIISASFIETSRLYARTLAKIDVKWLEYIGGELCKRSWSSPHWEKKTGRVTAFEKVTLFGLVIVSSRRVNYGRVNKKASFEAREIFIRSALIEGMLGGNYSFLKHNLSLADSFQEIEAKIRKRSVLNDEQSIYDFYDKHLTVVFDRHTLNRFLKQQNNKSILFMSESDICKALPDTEELYKFPETIISNGQSLKLEYKFQPGHIEDGVIVEIPASLHQGLKPTVFEWVVPGLLQEKIHWLLKALPKKIRKSLVPLPNCVDLVMDSLDHYKGSLYPALEKIIFKNYQVRIQRNDWQIHLLPLHLRMNYRLLDNNGKILILTRNFQELKGFALDIPEISSERAIDMDLPEKTGVLSWDFLDLETIFYQRDKSGKIITTYFATLFIDKKNNWLDVRWIDNSNKSKELNRKGVAFLYKLQFQKENKLLLKECKEILAKQSASLFALGMKGNFKEIAKNICDFLTTDVFEISDEEIPTKIQFENTITAIQKKGLLKFCRPRLNQVVKIFSKRRDVISTLYSMKERSQKINNFDQEKFDLFLNHLDAILPQDFLSTRSFNDLQHTQRYLNALDLRIIRAEQSPLKDSQKATRLTSFTNKLAHLDNLVKNNTTVCNKSILEYKTMLEEFKVSIFAPELGTAMVVSEKRLKLKWEDVMDHCSNVE